jgi:ferredoxin
MAKFINRHPRNVPGRFYVDADCTDCDLCRETAPKNIRRDDEHGYAYVYRQPTTPEEIASCEEGVEGCPTSAVGNDGESFDWQATPIRDWSIYDAAMQLELAGLTILSLEEHRLMETPFGWPHHENP